ncbi:MAG: NUDIX domain-containing protein [Spirochaetales bacterium]|nr:NUDIX domain-containing protein [Spirochaetales bacterium]
MHISLAGVAERNGKYFMALRKPGTAIGESWEFPGGKAEPGESHEQTLLREYTEEFASDIETGELIFESRFSNGNRDFILYVYKISFSGDMHFHPEHQKCAWVSPDDFDTLPMAESDRQIADFLKKAGR